MTQMVTLELPESIAAQLAELNEAMDRDKSSKDISPMEAASIMGVNVETLKTSARYGGCPFAIYGKKDSKSQQITKIPKLPFYLFMVQARLGVELIGR
ncbi:hypothetical protein SAMN04515656_1038 [Eubacterium aggregans]|uniref:Uncharacterized protein n=1 Tax=Eubacterium aggregans TaxID=81409 RepID=A0A1H3Y0C0_9FIRM|nr:hypothetical protein [Eubacterium aggregans]SEA05023.1 hypothetical protein SAMN04515656_1038 [Eubacterium aggregans]